MSEREKARPNKEGPALSGSKRMKGNINYLFIEKDPNRCGHLRDVRWYPKTKQLAKKESGS